MGIPKLKRTKFNTYEFVKKVNDKLFLYKDIKTGTNITFSRYDLGLINNTSIDKKIGIKIEKQYKTGIIQVYDKIDETTTEYENKEDVVKKIGFSWTYIYHSMQDKKWLKKRYFVEYKE